MALATRSLPALAALATVFLSTVYAGFQAYLVASGDVVPCGCVGIALEFTTVTFHAIILVVSIAMLGAALVLLFVSPSVAARAEGRQPASADQAGGPRW